MAYRLKRNEPVARGLQRIALKQLTAALSEARALGDARSDEAVHVARRHVKKVHALLRLVKPSLVRRHRASSRRLRRIDRLLAPIADAEAMVATLGRIAAQHPELPLRLVRTTRRGLKAEQARVDRQATAASVLPQAAALLRIELAGVPGWRLSAGGFRAVAPGLTRSIRRALRAMARATARPTAEHYHAWRLSVKDLWFHVRLLARRCGGALDAYRQGLEALDDCLGECHNCALLRSAVMTGALLPRDDAARVLRVVRRHEADLRARARRLGGDLHRESPEQVVSRARQAWRSAARAAVERPATKTAA